MVHAEEAPERVLLETKIVKEDGFQKQQGSSSAAEPITSCILTRAARYPYRLARAF